jgi:hypothetical protein
MGPEAERCSHSACRRYGQWRSLRSLNSVPTTSGTPVKRAIGSPLMEIKTHPTRSTPRSSHRLSPSVPRTKPNPVATPSPRCRYRSRCAGASNRSRAASSSAGYAPTVPVRYGASGYRQHSLSRGHP